MQNTQKRMKIVKAQTQSIIEANQAGDNQKVTFFNKSLARRLEKNKAIVQRHQQLQLNAQALSKKQAAKQGTDALPKPDIKSDVNFAEMSDEKLVSSIIVLGVSPADLIDGGVDTLRALKAFKEAQARIVQRQKLASYQVTNPGNKTR